MQYKMVVLNVSEVKIKLGLFTYRIPPTWSDRCIVDFLLNKQNCTINWRVMLFCNVVYVSIVIFDFIDSIRLFIRSQIPDGMIDEIGIQRRLILVSSYRLLINLRDYVDQTNYGNDFRLIRRIHNNLQVVKLIKASEEPHPDDKICNSIGLFGCICLPNATLIQVL